MDEADAAVEFDFKMLPLECRAVGRPSAGAHAGAFAGAVDDVRPNATAASDQHSAHLALQVPLL
ncbi:hypothetical protein [Acidocella aminolytica]|uniref:Uncharacterized protein n=1 Tax=Acidocella aminolytica 101 = DSM 11237 TaxID=1120923 RepID=A0A0D6PCU0_9PROT|nr:hypothetical protein [Acidocella aminolytica]GAN79590.1 hypothetical protein Aam_023_041 [Acidocella aminolytica 101 = DSM 11237]GBQ39060.1 hypothetical protein AA11237_1954 [Acidocella aminolytica 101 = DSM 11237]SHF27517.1 hypothetical protein SAMN02746095_02673 [Acidocella aminolytica 101 = DSM 11237]